MKHRSIASLRKALVVLACITGLSCSGAPADSKQLLPPLPKPLAAVSQKSGMRIGYIRVEKIITPDLAQATYHEWRDRVKELQGDIEGRYAKLAAVHQRIKDDEAELARKSKLLDERARQEKERDLGKRSRDLAADVEALNHDRDQALGVLQREIFLKVEASAKSLASRPGKEVDLILYAGAVYVSDSIDMTDQLIDVLNKEYDEEQAKKGKTPSASEPAKPLATPTEAQKAPAKK